MIGDIIKPDDRVITVDKEIWSKTLVKDWNSFRSNYGERSVHVRELAWGLALGFDRDVLEYSANVAAILPLKVTAEYSGDHQGTLVKAICGVGFASIEDVTDEA